MLQTLAALYARGVDVDWAAFERGPAAPRVALPTYPFQRARYWVDETTSARPAAIPDPAAVWECVVGAGRRQMEQGPLDLAADTYPAKWAALARLAATYATTALLELGCFTQAGERHTLAGLAERWSLTPARKHLLSRWLARLVAAGALMRDGDAFVSAVPLSTAALPTHRESARAALADTPALMDYVERCGSRLAAILAGAESPLETLFPGGSFATAEYLYQSWPVARYMNAIARAAVEAWVRAQPADLPLRVIEVGAGTGGTTSAVLPALPAERTVYHYTDVSTFFFGHAGRKFAAYPFIRTGLLDLERAPAEQGWTPASYHVVVAANVLHATQDLDRTLEHVRGLLAPGGLLVAYEATDHLPWFDVTTGLIEGWQRFDDQWRVDHPLLAPARWAEALQRPRLQGRRRVPRARLAGRDARSPRDRRHGPGHRRARVDRGRRRRRGRSQPRRPPRPPAKARRRPARTSGSPSPRCPPASVTRRSSATCARPSPGSSGSTRPRSYSAGWTTRSATARSSTRIAGRYGSWSPKTDIDPYRAHSARSQRGAHRRLRDRLRGPQSHLDLQVHRHDPAGRGLPRQTGPARRRRRTRAFPGRWTRPPDRRAGCGEPGMEAGPGGQPDIAGKPPGYLPRRASPGRRPRAAHHDGARRAPPPDERTEALRDTIAELLMADESRRRFAAMMFGLDIHYDLGEGHPCSDAACPISTSSPPTARCGSSPCCTMPGPCCSTSVSPAASTSRHGRIGSSRSTPDTLALWELPVLGVVTAPTAVLIRPDGYVAWVGDQTDLGLPDALTTWFGPPIAA